MRHRFFREDDLLKIGWGSDSTLDEWYTILAWVLKTLNQSEERLHLLIDFSDIYVVSERIFQPAFAARLALHPNAGCFLLVSNNPVFVHFVNAHWVHAMHDSTGVRAFLEVSDALSWLRDKPLLRS